MKLTLVLFLFLFSATTWAKRAPPPKIAPLMKNGVEYFYVVEPLTTDCPAGNKACGQRVFMTATFKKTKVQMWKTELYQNKFDPKKETDAQEIYPKSMAFIKRDRIELVDETTRHFFIFMKDGKMDWPAGTRNYRGRK